MFTFTITELPKTQQIILSDNVHRCGIHTRSGGQWHLAGIQPLPVSVSVPVNSQPQLRISHCGRTRLNKSVEDFLFGRAVRNRQWRVKLLTKLIGTSQIHCIAIRSETYVFVHPIRVTSFVHSFLAHERLPSYARNKVLILLKCGSVAQWFKALDLRLEIAGSIPTAALSSATVECDLGQVVHTHCSAPLKYDAISQFKIKIKNKN